jgi:alpha-beta hydrolase superfamily lysophospholipase
MTLWPGEADETLTVSGHAGARLHVERFSPAGGESATSLVFLHGIGAYAGPLRRFARDLADRGLTVYLPDLRGHGRSGGLRGEMGSPGVVLADIACLMDHVRATHPGGEVVLGGESMGGLIALAYAASRLTPPDRLILLAPALRPRAFNAPIFSKNRAPKPATGQRLPGFALHGPVPAETVRDHGFRDANLADPMMLQRGTISYLSVIGRLMVGWSLRYPSRVSQPTLLLHGDSDSVLYSHATEVLHRRLAHSEMHVIPGAWHNILWDPTREETTRTIIEWLLRPDAHAGGPGG